MRFLLLLIFALGLGVASDENVFAQQRRLIQVDEERQWLNDDEILALSQKSHERGACPGFMDITDFPQKWQRRVAPMNVPVFLPYQLEGGARQVLLRPFDGHFYLEQDVRAAFSRISIQFIDEQLQRLTSFHNRDYRSEWGVQAANYLEETLREMAQHRSDVRIEKIYHNGFTQPSVMLQIFSAPAAGAQAQTLSLTNSGSVGTSALGQGAVILGAHFDTINVHGFTNAGRSRARAPGADDNASGTVSVLEVVRNLLSADWRPQRDLIFIFYAGEERGLLGSQEVAERFREVGREVAGVLQLDMTMFSSAEAQEGSGLKPLGVISDYVSPQLTMFTKAVLDHYVRMPWVETRCGYACSDHASWYDASYPSAFVIEAPMDNLNMLVHSENDRTEILSTGHGLPFVKLALAFMIELGGKAQ